MGPVDGDLHDRCYRGGEGKYQVGQGIFGGALGKPCSVSAEGHAFLEEEWVLMSDLIRIGPDSFLDHIGCIGFLHRRSLLSERCHYELMVRHVLSCPEVDSR